jgi:hypothetical protein
MRRPMLACSAWALLCAGSLGAVRATEPVTGANPTFDLFTESEAATWNSAAPKEPTDFATRDLRDDGSTPTCRSSSNNDADNPQIKVLAPVLEKPLLMPVDIDLLFVQAGTAHIRPDTFRVCYLGLMTMDITKRITDHVTVSEKGLHVSGALLPRGNHRLLLLVADERGRLARREALFHVL